MHEAKENGLGRLSVKGSGATIREFLFSGDLASACYFLSNQNNEFDFFNVGTGVPVTISELASKVRDVVGYRGSVVFELDDSKAAVPRLLDVTRINKAGWCATTSLSEGLEKTYRAFLEDLDQGILRQ